MKTTTDKIEQEIRCKEHIDGNKVIYCSSGREAFAMGHECGWLDCYDTMEEQGRIVAASESDE